MFWMNVQFNPRRTAVMDSKSIIKLDLLFTSELTKKNAAVVYFPNLKMLILNVHSF